MMVDFFMDVENAMHRLFQINSKKQGYGSIEPIFDKTRVTALKLIGL